MGNENGTSSEDDIKWWLDTVQATTEDHVVREYDATVWNTIQTHTAPSCNERERWIQDEDIKSMIIALREKYRIHMTAGGIPTKLRLLDSRRSPIGLTLAASLGDRLSVKKILSSSEFKEIQSKATSDQALFVLDHALFFAVLSGQEAAIPALLEQGASVNGYSYKSIGSPLQAAVIAKKGAIVRMLLQRGAKCFSAGALGSSLHIAARNGSERMAQLLLEHGYKVDSMGGTSEGVCHETPLLTAALHGREKMMCFLIAQGANINGISEECHYGFTPLRSATKIGNLEAMQLLLKYGANPAVGPYSALHDAAYYGHYKALKMLMMHLTNVDYVKKGDMGMPITPLDSAMIVDPHMRNGPDYLNIIRHLLEKGATSKFKIETLGGNAIHRWAQLRHPDMTGYRTLNAQDRDDFKAILLILLDRGQDINFRDSKGQTPLHRALNPTWKDNYWHLREQWGAEKAAPHNPLPHIALLLEHGADPDIKDNNGKTPMDLANGLDWDAGYMQKCPPW